MRSVQCFHLDLVSARYKLENTCCFHKTYPSCEVQLYFWLDFFSYIFVRFKILKGSSSLLLTNEKFKMLH